MEDSVKANRWKERMDGCVHGKMKWHQSSGKGECLSLGKSWQEARAGEGQQREWLEQDAQDPLACEGEARPPGTGPTAWSDSHSTPSFLWPPGAGMVGSAGQLPRQGGEGIPTEALLPSLLAFSLTATSEF